MKTRTSRIVTTLTMCIVAFWGTCAYPRDADVLNRELCEAAKAGDLEAVKRLLGGGANPNAAQEKGAETCLILASRKGHNAVVQLLVEKGAEIDKKDGIGSTALMYASFMGQSDIASLLIANGANRELRNSLGTKAADMAKIMGHKHVLALLTQTDAAVGSSSGQASGAVPLPVQKLLIVVLDFEELLEQRKQGSLGLLIAIASYTSDLEEAVKEVKEANATEAAVGCLLSTLRVRDDEGDPLNSLIWGRVADALGELGPAAKSAVPTLEQLSKQRPSFAKEAGAAIDKIRVATSASPSVETSPKPSQISSGLPSALLPKHSTELVGQREVRVVNPNDFAVVAGIRSGRGGSDLTAPANGQRSAHVPDGRYEIYFVYSNKPDALFQGDSFVLDGNGVEIKIVKVVGGNYGIRQVK